MKRILPALLMAAAAIAGEPLVTGEFRWNGGSPLVAARDVGGIHAFSMKDPSIVRHDGKWHLFCTMRGEPRSHCTVYCSFEDWSGADAAERHVLPMHEGFFCAPQVFFFTPHRKWYLICQASDKSWSPEYQPAFATSSDVANPGSWSKLTPMFGRKPPGISGWLDFWVICDDTRAHLFFTSNDGRMWRSETKLAEFPLGWSDPVVALKGDVFEASHTYRVRGSGKYLTIIEAQNGHGWRYQKAYLADRLDGVWTELAATKDKTFASMRNITFSGARWTDSISHGELLRASNHEHMEVDPAKLEWLYQGFSDSDRAGKKYGEIPWKLGLLKPAE